MQILNFLDNLVVSELRLVNTYIAEPINYPMKTPSRYRHGFFYTISGTETYHFENKAIKATPGSVLYIPKGTKYYITFEGDLSIVIVLDFDTETLPTAPFCIQFPIDSHIKSHFSDIEKEWSRKNIGYLPKCFSIIYKIISHTAEQHRQYFNSNMYVKLEKSMDYLHESYTKNNFRISQLSEIAGVSHRHFETLFYKKYGTSPKEYVLSLKIEKAKELLLNEKMLIKDIALSLGYSDIYHFGKLFKSKTGYTPYEYKKRFH